MYNRNWERGMTRHSARKTRTENTYTRIANTCLAKQYDGENLEEIIAFMNENTQGEWSCKRWYDTQSYGLSNPLCDKSKFLTKGSWIVVHSETKIQTMTDTQFHKIWE